MREILFKLRNIIVLPRAYVKCNLFYLKYNYSDLFYAKCDEKYNYVIFLNRFYFPNNGFIIWFRFFTIKR